MAEDKIRHGIFEGLRVYDGEIFRLSAHLKRLYQGARSLLLNRD